MSLTQAQVETILSESTEALGAVVLVDALEKIYTIPVHSDGPQKDALIAAMEAFATAAQIEVLQRLLKVFMKRNDSQSYFVVAGLAEKLCERSTHAINRLENLLTLFPI